MPSGLVPRRSGDQPAISNTLQVYIFTSNTLQVSKFSSLPAECRICKNLAKKTNKCHVFKTFFKDFQNKCSKKIQSLANVLLLVKSEFYLSRKAGHEEIAGRKGRKETHVSFR